MERTTWKARIVKHVTEKVMPILDPYLGWLG
jgi:hypothetical protein